MSASRQSFEPADVDARGGESANDASGSASSADVAANGVGSEAWVELARQWQAAAAQWAAWWAGSPTGCNADMHSYSRETISPSVTFPVLSFDASKVAALTERYRRDMENLWRSVLESPAGVDDDDAEPDPRFRSSDWKQPYFALLKRAYLRHAAYVRELAQLAEVDAATRQRLQFVVQQYVDALSPTNFLATNPEALKRALDSNGASLVQGLRNFADDAQRGRISTNDPLAFEVGRNLAVTPGSVVYRNELFELLQYRASTETVFREPLVVVPPCINKYYVLDLQPDNSFARFAVAQGRTVFMMSWRNIPAELGGLQWDDYIEQGVLTALAVASAIAHSEQVHALGFCVGGTLLASALAVLAARGERRVASATLLTTLLDFADPGEIGVYISDQAIASREPRLLAGQRFEGRDLATAFSSLRANDLVWNYVVNNYLKGRQPPAFDLLFWNADGADLPGPMMAWYLRRLYLENRLCEKNALTLCGVPIDLSRIALPAYVLATRDDHIVPWHAAFRTLALLRGPGTFVLASGGHIAGVINPPGKNRRNYWSLNDERDSLSVPDTAEAWLAEAEVHPGSWWPHWAGWLAARGSARRPAPSHEGSELYAPLAPAPGDFVVRKVL